MSSKHLQTRRLLSTLQSYLLEVRAMLISQWKEANEKAQDWVDHSGVLRDSKTGNPISVEADEEDEEAMRKC